MRSPSECRRNPRVDRTKCEVDECIARIEAEAEDRIGLCSKFKRILWGRGTRVAVLSVHSPMSEPCYGQVAPYRWHSVVDQKIPQVSEMGRCVFFFPARVLLIPARIASRLVDRICFSAMRANSMSLIFRCHSAP
jgi:hypothetical protein